MYKKYTEYDEEQKERIYKWREENPEKYKEIQDKAMKKYFDKNRKRKNEVCSNYYYRHKEEILKRMKEKRDKSKQNKDNK